MGEDENFDVEKNREQLGWSIKCLSRSSKLFFVAFFISGIWNAVIASRAVTDYYVFLAGRTTFRILVSLSVLSFSVIAIFFFLLAMLYFLGFAFKFHTFLATVTCATVAGAVALLFYDITLGTIPVTKKYKSITKDMLKNQPDNINLTKWKKDVGCNSYETCLKKVDPYFDLNTMGQMIMSSIILVLVAIGVSGIVYSSCYMKYIQRPEPSDEEARAP